MRLIAAVILVTTFTGCTTTTNQGERPPGPLPAITRPVYNLTGYSPAFKDGYIDGCETAKKTRFGLKNKNRFSTDTQYKLGWNDGFSICRGKQ
jgi:hypothetical protein